MSGQPVEVLYRLERPYSRPLRDGRARLAACGDRLLPRWRAGAAAVPPARVEANPVIASTHEDLLSPLRRERHRDEDRDGASGPAEGIRTKVMAAASPGRSSSRATAAAMSSGSS